MILILVTGWGMFDSIAIVTWRWMSAHCFFSLMFVWFDFASVCHFLFVIIFFFTIFQPFTTATNVGWSEWITFDYRSTFFSSTFAPLIYNRVPWWLVVWKYAYPVGFLTKTVVVFFFVVVIVVGFRTESWVTESSPIVLDDPPPPPPTHTHRNPHMFNLILLAKQRFAIRYTLRVS